MALFNNVYQNKKVLVTGNTGFKGSWLSAWLLQLGAKVHGISDRIPTVPSHFEEAKLAEQIHYLEVDVCDFDSVQQALVQIQPDFVFHLAAQPLVRLSYAEPLQTLKTNMMGTANILEVLRLIQHPCNAVMITSDKCYDNVEWTWGYRETDALGGKDPYSASKGGAELVIKTYAYSYFADAKSPVKVAVGRAGNVIGGGDWAPDRIVPDCMKSWSKSQKVEIRSPHATRPWQHVLEPLSGYLVLGQKLAENPTLNSEPFNFGPNANQNFTVAELIEEMKKHWSKAEWKDVSDPDQVHEANLLKLCCDKALHTLGWMSTLEFEETIRFTVEWYKYYYESPNLNTLELTLSQISEYTHIAQKRGLLWTQ